MAASKKICLSRSPASQQIVDHSRDCLRPFAVRGAALKWSCFQWDTQTWMANFEDTSLSFRLHSFGAKQIAWENEPVARYEISLKDFIEWNKQDPESILPQNPLKNVSKSNLWGYSSYNYLAKLKSPPLKFIETIKWSEIGFGTKLGEDGMNTTLWIGSKGAYTPCHYDTYGYNLVAQIKGRKKWVMFKPEFSRYLKPTRIPYEESSVFSEINFNDFDEKNYPDSKYVYSYETILNPGDVLYVPNHYWHWVKCIEDDGEACISVNQWLPHPQDHVNRIGEAFVSLMASNIFPNHQPADNNWINDLKNPMLSPEESMNTLRFLKGKNLSQVSELEVTCLPQEIEEMKSCYQSFSKLVNCDQTEVSSLGRQNLIDREIINCLLQPNVISEIVKNFH